jgi:hypothetical protein
MSKLKAKKKRKCKWKEDEDGVWDTECGNRFELIEGAPKDNRMKFCPYCGGVLEGK